MRLSELMREMDPEIYRVIYPPIPVAINVNSLPFIEVAKKLACEVHIHSDYARGSYWHKSDMMAHAITMKSYIPFVWFHELAHAVDFSYLKSKKDKSLNYQCQTYSDVIIYNKMPAEIVANNVGQTLCEELNLPMDSKMAPFVYEPSWFQKRRIKKILKFIRSSK
jgi:hypothetical protein